MLESCRCPPCQQHLIVEAQTKPLQERTFGQEKGSRAYAAKALHPVHASQQLVAHLILLLHCLPMFASSHGLLFPACYYNFKEHAPSFIKLYLTKREAVFESCSQRLRAEMKCEGWIVPYCMLDRLLLWRFALKQTLNHSSETISSLEASRCMALIKR